MGSLGRGEPGAVGSRGVGPLPAPHLLRRGEEPCGRKEGKGRMQHGAPRSPMCLARVSQRFGDGEEEGATTFEGGGATVYARLRSGSVSVKMDEPQSLTKDCWEGNQKSNEGVRAGRNWSVGLEHGRKQRGDGERGTRLLECLRGDAHFRGARGSLATQRGSALPSTMGGHSLGWIPRAKPIGYHLCVRGRMIDEYLTVKHVGGFKQQQSHPAGLPIEQAAWRFFPLDASQACLRGQMASTNFRRRSR